MGMDEFFYQKNNLESNILVNGKMEYQEEEEERILMLVVTKLRVIGLKGE